MTSEESERRRLIHIYRNHRSSNNAVETHVQRWFLFYFTIWLCALGVLVYDCLGRSMTVATIVMAVAIAVTQSQIQILQNHHLDWLKNNINSFILDFHYYFYN